MFLSKFSLKNVKNFCKLDLRRRFSKTSVCRKEPDKDDSDKADSDKDSTLDVELHNKNLMDHIPALIQSYREVTEQSEKRREWAERSFVVNLYRGRYNGEQIFPYPQLLTYEKKQELVTMLRKIDDFFRAHRSIVREHDEKEEFSAGYLQLMKDMGLFRMHVPTSYGGLGFNNVQITAVLQRIGEYDLSLACLVCEHCCLCGSLIDRYCNKAQKARFFPAIVEGKIVAFALNERRKLETQATSISSRAIRQAIASNTLTLSVFMYERGENDSVVISDPIQKMGLRSLSMCNMGFLDVAIPEENIIGEMGQGYIISMDCLNQSRNMICSIVSGALQPIIKKTMTYSKQGTDYGRKIYTYSSIEGKIGLMAVHQYVLESMTFLISGRMDEMTPDLHLEAAMSKYLASLDAWRTTDHAMQIFGDLGYFRIVGLERILRDLRFYLFYGGTRNYLRLFISLTAIQYAAIDNKEIQETYRKDPGGHLGLIFGEVHKENEPIVKRRSKPIYMRYVHPTLTPLMKQIERYVSQFGIRVKELLKKHGKNIVNEQYLLCDLADNAILIYALLATISRCSIALKTDSDTMERELVLTNTFAMFVDAKVGHYSPASDAKSTDIVTNLRKIIQDMMKETAHEANHIKII